MKNMLTLLLMAIFVACGPNNDEQKEPNEEIIDEGDDGSDDGGSGINADLYNTNSLQLDKIVLPPGFKIDVYSRVNNARSLAISPSGTLFVSNRGGDNVYAVRDTNGDMKADEIFTIVQDDDDMEMPNGVAFFDGDLYVAEVSKLWKFPDIENNLENPQKELIYDDYPTDRHHGWKYIAFGPDGKLYVPVGTPCNICESQDERYASITRMDPDGSNKEIYVHGVRNTVGFTWHPETGEMWFTDNGRDNIGANQSETDNSPPCELNRVAEAGQHFGYPYCHGGTISDPDFGHKRDCDEFVEPAQNLGPHVAPLGLKFCTSDNFPASYQNKIFIAEHGSWNRSSKIGYRVQIVTEENGVGTSYITFAQGWMDDDSQNVWGKTGGPGLGRGWFYVII